MTGRLFNSFRRGMATAAIPLNWYRTVSAWLNGMRIEGGRIERQPDGIVIYPNTDPNITDHPWRIRAVDDNNMTITKSFWVRNGKPASTFDDTEDCGYAVFDYRTNRLGSGTLAAGEEWALVAFLGDSVGSPTSIDADQIVFQFVYKPDLPDFSREVGAEVIAYFEIGTDGKPFLPIPQRITEDIVDEVPEGEWAVSIKGSNFYSAQIQTDSSTWRRNGQDASYDGSLYPNLGEGTNYVYARRLNSGSPDPSLIADDITIEVSSGPVTETVWRNEYKLLAIVEAATLGSNLFATRIYQCQHGRITDHWTIPDGDTNFEDESPSRKTLSINPDSTSRNQAYQINDSENAEYSAVSAPLLDLDSSGDGAVKWAALDTNRLAPLGKSVERINAGENGDYIQLKGFLGADALGRSLITEDKIVVRKDNGADAPEVVYVPWKDLGGSGVQGPPGPPGADGFQGFQGYQGFQGFQGPHGCNVDSMRFVYMGHNQFAGGEDYEVYHSSCGTEYYDGHIIIPSGPQGPQGGVDTSGNVSFGGLVQAQGFQSADGTQGTTMVVGGLQFENGLLVGGSISGSQGFQGFQGPQGIAGTIGVDGLQGNQGLVGNQGTQGPQGVAGVQGNQGVQGGVGVQGPAPDSSLYAKLDGSNQPFTGNLNISKATPTLTLTSTDDSNNTAVLSRSVTSRALTLKNYVSQPAGSNYGASLTTGQYATASISGSALTALTIQGWVYLPTTSGTDFFWSWADSNNSDSIMILAAWRTTNKIEVFVSGGYNILSAALATGWHYVSLTYSGTVWTLYVDALTPVTYTGAFGNAGTVQFNLNNYQHGTYTSVHTYDETKILNFCKNSTQISADYASGSGVYGDAAETGLIAGWHFDDGTGTTATDYSGHGNTITFTGGQTWAAGKVPAPATAVLGTAITYKDGVSSSERGTLQLGDQSSGYGTKNVYEGLTHNFNILGSSKGVLSSAGLALSTPEIITGSSDAIQLKVIGNATQTAHLMDIFASDGTTARFHIDGTGNVGIGTTAPTAVLHLKAGTATAGTAPLKFTSGTLLGTAEAGGVEFLTDDFYYTITSPSSYTSQYPPLQNGTYVVATSILGANYQAYYGTDPSKSLTGSWINGGWVGNSASNQRLHIDLGSAKVITKIYYENGHENGGIVIWGVQNFTLWGSNTAGDFADTVYANNGTWVQITGLSQSYFDQHTGSDIADPKYITFAGNTTAYRYYAFKFADNRGGSYMGIRRVELQAAGANGRYTSVLTNGANLTSGRLPFATTNGRLTDSSTLTYSATTGLAQTKPNTITGSTDAIQLKVVSNATQTNDILDVFASDGTTRRFIVSGAGNVTIGDVTNNNNSALYVLANSTNASSYIYGQTFRTTKTVATDDANTNEGLDIQFTSAGAGNFTAGTLGIAGVNYHNGSGTVALQRGTSFIVGCTGSGTIGNVTNRYAFEAQAFSNGVGALASIVTGSSYGLHIKNMALYNTPVTSGGILIDDSTNVVGTSKYGIKIGNISGGATNNYSIHTGTATSYFGGNVGIGVTAPDSKLHIVGSSDTIQLKVTANATQTSDLLEVLASDGTTVLVKINGTGVLFPIQKTTATAPTYVKGGIYFDTTLNKLRIGGATAWETVTSA